MGTEQLLIFRIENDLRKLRNKRADIKDLEITARLKRLEAINKPMFEDFTEQLETIVNPKPKTSPIDELKKLFKD